MFPAQCQAEWSDNAEFSGERVIGLTGNKTQRFRIMVLAQFCWRIHLLVVSIAGKLVRLLAGQV